MWNILLRVYLKFNVNGVLAFLIKGLYLKSYAYLYLIALDKILKMAEYNICIYIE